TPGAFQRELLQARGAIELEAVGRIASRQTKEFQRTARDSRELTLEPGTTDLFPARHVARPRDQVVALGEPRHHRTNRAQVVGLIGHHYYKRVASSRGKPRLERVGRSAPQSVPYQPVFRGRRRNE